MDVNDLAAAGMTAEESDLLDQPLPIVVDRVAPQRRLGLAAAVEAQLRAVGHIR
jgi:hypothetical protein